MNANNESGRIEGMRTLQCADLFAGAGGFSLAALRCGLNVRFAVEFDNHACDTYRNNIVPQAHGLTLQQGDIRNVNFREIAQDVFGSVGGCDLILGGPPCQGYSAHRINDAGVGDDRNDLIHTYFDAVEALSPQAFLLENVPGMLWPRHKDYLEAFYRRGESSGYSVMQPVIMDARDFGVPQRRKRVFILGFKKGSEPADITWPLTPTHARDADADSDLTQWVNCSDVFAPAPKDDPNNCHMNHRDELIEVFRATPINGGSRRDSGRVLPCHAKHDGHKDVYGRINPTEPGPTMTTACINPSKGRFVHPTEHHGITVRQAARMQTFPDDFIFSGGLMAAGKQVGNAVPVKLGEAILSALKTHLSSDELACASAKSEMETA